MGRCHLDSPDLDLIALGLAEVPEESIISNYFTHKNLKPNIEQISPMEVEEPLLDHPWVETVVCFSVPSKVYGEEVGCAVIISSLAPENVDIIEVKKELKNFLRVRGLPPLKWPTKWKLLTSETNLPKTKTKKIIRIGTCETPKLLYL